MTVQEIDRADFNKAVDQRAKETAQDVVVDAVSYIIDPEDDEAAEAMKSEAKDLPGDLQGKIEESVDKALKKKQDAQKGGTEKLGLSELISLGDNQNKTVNAPVAEKMEGHWLFDEGKTRHKVGSGKVAADMVTMCFRSYLDGRGLDWDFMKQEADRLGAKQVSEIIEKNQQDTDFSQGGALIPPEFAADVIGFLHGSTAVRSIDHVSMELSSELQQGRFSSTATANYRGEGGSVNSSNIGTDQITFSENELVVRIIQSRRFMRNAPGGALQVMRDDMRRVMGTKQDSVLLRSPGTQNEPTGILNLVNSSNKFNADSTDPNTTTQIIQDLTKQQKLVHADGKVPADRPCYIMPEAVKMALSVDTDSDGNLSSLAMMMGDNEFMGAPVKTTNQIPTDLGGGNDETEVYYVEGSQYVIADATDVQVREYDQATIPDASGSDRNLAEHGEMAIEMVLSHDANLRHDVGASVIEQVDWHTEAF